MFEEKSVTVLTNTSIKSLQNKYSKMEKWQTLILGPCVVLVRGIAHMARECYVRFTVFKALILYQTIPCMEKQDSMLNFYLFCTNTSTN
jgi:hypothetical protein